MGLQYRLSLLGHILRETLRHPFSDSFIEVRDKKVVAIFNNGTRREVKCTHNPSKTEEQQDD